METIQDPYAAQLIQRCVIVQKDEKGYGLTVSGDNPVFIQSVKDDGAASRAGVQQGDRIIKVNGTLVTNCNHLEVVKLIRSASYAALTLLGLPPGMKNQSPLSPPHQAITTSKPNQRRPVTQPTPVTPEKDAELKSEKMTTFRRMLDQELELYEKTKAEYDIHPTEKLLKELNGIKTRIKVVEHQLNKTASMQPKSQMTEAREGVNPDQEPENRNARHERSNKNSQDNHKEKRKTTEIRSWLPHGIVHARQRSSPESLGVTIDAPPGTNLKRNNSDAQSKDAARKKHLRSVVGAEAEIRKRSDNIEALGRSYSLPAEPGGGESDMGDSSPNSTPPTKRRTDTDSSVDTFDSSASSTNPSASNHNLKTATVGAVEPFSQAEISSSQVTATPQVPIISMEDDDFQSDNETPHGNVSQYFEDHGPFISLEQLEKKPAHMSIFLHYLISNSDPSSLFFYLVTDNYRTGSLKEMKKWVYEIFSTFLAPSAPLRIQVSDSIVHNIDNTMNTQLQNEEAMKSVFLAARLGATTEVQELLADFRAKRALGLGSIFGDQQLHNEDMDRLQELKIVEQTLMPHLDRLTTLEAEREDKNVAMAFAITTFMKQVGVRVTSNSALERCPSFTARDKRPKWAKNKKQHIKGHQFVEMHYQSTVFCNHCNGLLWGIGFQGYQCQNCEFNIHKTGLCLDQLEDQCQGKEGKKMKRDWRRMIPGGQRRTSDRMSQYLPSSVFFTGDKKDEIEKPATSPNATSPIPPGINVRAGNAEDEEITQLKEKINVDNLVKQFEDKKDDPLVSSRTSLQTDSGISESFDRLQDVAEGEVSASSKRSFLARSASLKTKGEEKRERRPPGDRRSRSSNERTPSQSTDDVDVDGHSVVTALNNTSHASSSSSLSTRHDRSQDSPSASNDSLSSRPIEEDEGEDSDMEAETDPPNWQDLVDKDIVKRLKPKEVKRQEVINELFHTEKSHVRNLKVLDRVFYRPMLREQILSKELIHAVFPNLSEMLQIHGPLNDIMKKERKTSQIIQEVGSFLLKTFDGESGETAKRVCATFCQNQKAALEMLKNRRKKDSKLSQFLADAEGNTLCRRLPLQAIITTGMQRLTKYPLLIENLMKYTQPKLKEYAALERALVCTKKLLANVNQAVKECENHQRLLDINRHLEKGPFERSNHPIAAEYKNLSLTSRKLLHDGPVTWKLSKTKVIDLYALLLEDILVLLQKQDDRYIMKCHSTTVPTQLEEKKNTHSPIIKINSVLCREVATNKRAFFLVSTSTAGPQIYELTTISMSERQTWMDMILKTQEEAKKAARGGTTPVNTNTISILNSMPDLHEEEGEDVTSKSSAEGGPTKVMEEESISVEISNPPEVSQPEVVTQSTKIAEDVRQDSPQDMLSSLSKTLQEDTSTEARASEKANGIVALSDPLQVLLKTNFEKRDTKREELVLQAVDKIQQLSKHLQNDVSRLEFDLNQATQELRRVQQALLKQPESNLEEQRRRSRQEALYVRSKDSERTAEEKAKAAQNRISLSGESGGSSTDSEEYGVVESSETEEGYTPKERPSSLVVDVDEGPRDQVTMMAALVSDFHKAEKQEAVAVSNEGLVTLQRAEVRKVTDVDSAEIDQFMQRIGISAETTVNGVTSGTKEASSVRQPQTESSMVDFDQEVGMTEIAEELPNTEHWEDTTVELPGTLENTVVMATRLDDLLNEDSESDQETVVPSGSFLNTSPEIDSSSVGDTNAILRSTNDGTETTNQDQLDQDSLENVVNVEMNSQVVGNTAMILTDVGSTPPQTLLDVSSGESRPTSLVSVDSLACDDGSEGGRLEEVTVLRSADETKNSGILSQAKNITFTHPPYLV
ncbi:rho guanine nucleotide exchange factor 11-like isoform X12 [Asterias amurensis]|uniref:rho guanine nucleotide exchange factor 11-like isoform X12 n=1 Tax=Asterias amurensis TaxID=7602 RepID=UPI003AB1DB83